MKNNKNYRKVLGTLVSITLLVLTAVLSIISPTNADDHKKADSLYIGDIGDDSVKRFNAKTGEFLGNFVAPGSDGLRGPMGLIFNRGKLNVVNLNVFQEFAGEILRYQRNTGEFVDALVPCNPPFDRDCDPNAPFGPRGIVRGFLPTVYVTDQGPVPNFTAPGAVKQYNAYTGDFIRDLDPAGFSGEYFPRSLVFGPDHHLYVTVSGILDPSLDGFDPLAGYILRFNPFTGKFVDVFAEFDPSASDCSNALHRPDGLTFGPDRKLYVTSFRANADDTDKILIFDGKTGQCRDQIDLDQVGEDRAFAQALLFGPGGFLFVPISGNGPDTGAVRRYDVADQSFTDFVLPSAQGGPLLNPWYLTFGKTDPGTLAYHERRKWHEESR